ncbi:MAG: 50S ribosomal protein L25 [Planctomycetota bacterium]|nr:50S ribosomal protein L25 [Planctomycetota bacterium]
MSEQVKLNLQKREKLGTAENRRLRKQKKTPGNVYGHGQESVSVVVDSDVLRSAVTGGTHLLDIELDGKGEKAMFREMQWDSFGEVIQHFDLLRVDANERVRVSIPIELKGTAPGALAGGIVELVLHEVEIDCLAIQIPDNIVVRINELQLGEAIHVKELVLTEGVHVHAQPDAIVVHVVQPAKEEETATEGGAEPEVIGKKPDADEEE